MSSDDNQLIRQCLAGRTEAFGELVIRYQDRLCNSLFRVLGSADDARDAAQDAFVQAFQKLKTFRGNSAFYSWLFRIALNAAATQRRRTRTRPTSIDSMREMSGRTPIDPHPETAPSHSLERAERQKAVQAALAALPAEFRIPLVLKEVDGMKYQEIAEIVGCPIGTVRSRIHRARAELRQRLASHLYEEESSLPQE
ncbi:MAG TPA: sigma-70 family RNA polymerase sigma factor [Planctomycetaceae bacterium]|nr:sigma-70 family RNA polymerase sigma factor [Planctomycetaceae bacterium]